MTPYYWSHHNITGLDCVTKGVSKQTYQNYWDQNFYTSSTVRMVPHVFCILVYMSTSESVHPTEHFVKTMQCDFRFDLFF